MVQNMCARNFSRNATNQNNPYFGQVNTFLEIFNSARFRILKILLVGKIIIENFIEIKVSETGSQKILSFKKIRDSTIKYLATEK